MANVRPESPIAADMARGAARKVAEQSGADAVTMSIQQNRMQQNATLDGTEKDERSRIVLRNTRQNQFVGNKNFVNTAGVWVDSDYSDGMHLPTIEVKFASEEYFTLAASDPQLAQYLALGEQVIVVWKGKVYRVAR